MTSLARYVLQSRIMAILTAPFIYAVIIPFVLLDLFVTCLPDRLLSCFMAYPKRIAGIILRWTGTSCNT